jgi:hypothetical protein
MQWLPRERWTYNKHVSYDAQDTTLGCSGMICPRHTVLAKGGQGGKSERFTILLDASHLEVKRMTSEANKYEAH